MKNVILFIAIASGFASGQTAKSVSAFMAHADVLEHIKRPTIVRTVEVATRDRAVVDFDCPKGWEVDQSALDVEFHSAAEFLHLSLAFRCRLPTMSEIQWRAYVKSWDEDEERELAKTGMHLDATPQTGHSLRWEVNLPQPVAVKKPARWSMNDTPGYAYQKAAEEKPLYIDKDGTPVWPDKGWDVGDRRIYYDLGASKKSPDITVPMTSIEIAKYNKAKSDQELHPQIYYPNTLAAVEGEIIGAHQVKPAGDCNWKSIKANPKEGYVGRIESPNVVYAWGWPDCALYAKSNPVILDKFSDGSVLEGRK